VSSLISGKALREKKTKLVRLPSLGPEERVLMRKPNLLSMVKESKDGQPVDLLTGLILESAQNGGVVKMPEPDAKNLPKLRSAMEEICRACLVSPRIVDNPQAEDEIGIDDLTDIDKVFIMNWAFGRNGAAAAAFPAEPDAVLEPVPTGGDLQATPGEIAGDQE
jgi:hypothetical protein